MISQLNQFWYLVGAPSVASDAPWNKPFEAHLTEHYDDWLANGIHEDTAGRHMKPATKRKVVEWI